MMILQQEVLNKRIGTQAWKKYLSAAFWNYITTPINFSITLLTAIATGQAATANILTPQQTLIILFVFYLRCLKNKHFTANGCLISKQIEIYKKVLFLNAKNE